MTPNVQSLTPSERMAACREHLLKLGRCEVEPKDASHGICQELETLFDVDDIRLQYEILHQWPEKIGTFVVPVEGTVATYHANRDKWTPSTPFGAKRRRLCLWLADNLTIDLFE